MANNNIEVTRGDTCLFTCTIDGLESLSGYTAKAFVKKYKSDSQSVIEKQGDIADLVASFEFSKDDNDITPRRYIIMITLENGTYKFTPVEAEYFVKPTGT